MERPVIKISFPPTGGYWDGGTKSKGEFTPELFAFSHPGVGRFIKWGCFSLNFWFTAKAGRSWKEARACAVKRLKRIVAPNVIIE